MLPHKDREKLIVAVEASRAGDMAATEAIVLSFAPYVFFAARKTKKKELFDDLTQEGLIGIMEAIDKWDYKSFSGCFLTFARWSIFRRMMDCIRGLATVRLPERVKKIEGAFDSMDADLHNNEAGASWHNMLAVDGNTPADDCAEREDAKTVMEYVENMPQMEREALLFIYNFDDSKETTQEKLRMINRSQGLIYTRAKIGVERIRNAMDGISDEPETLVKLRTNAKKYREKKRGIA